MKKSSKFLLSFLMAVTIIFGLVGCSEDKVTFTSKTVNDLSFDLPDNFKDFENDDGVMITTNEVFNYLIYRKGQDNSETFQNLTFAYNKNAETSLKANIENVKNSIVIK